MGERPISLDQPKEQRNWPVIQVAVTVVALAYVLTASYPATALAALISIFFAAYLWMRFMIFFENDRFTPNRLRVGMTWALIGIHDETNEFDRRPVRVYFALLAVLFAGLILRPFVNVIIT